MNNNLWALDKAFKSLFFIQNQANILKLIKLLINLNDFEKVILLMLNDNNLLIESLPMIKRRRYTQITKKSLESFLRKSIEIIHLGQGIQKILDMILIVLTDKLSISNDIKTNIFKSMEYLLRNAKHLLNEHCYISIRLIIIQLSNR